MKKRNSSICVKLLSILMIVMSIFIVGCFGGKTTSSDILDDLDLKMSQFKDQCQRISYLSPITVKDSTASMGFRMMKNDLLYRKLLQNPAEYENLFCYDTDLFIESKGKTNDDYVTYLVRSRYDKVARWGYHILIDMRDDVQKPNFAPGMAIQPYMIFKGIQNINGDDYLYFHMIDAERPN